jgi:nicotinate-nucleotide--dimethylbenzimidazole phosphoribosyltransferase
MQPFAITPVNTLLLPDIRHKIDHKTKPVGALGQLEMIASRICLIQQQLSLELHNPHILVFAADHGIAREGVSKYPAEVTYQMVLNFLNGGAAINVFCRQNGITLKVIDAGVNGTFPSHELLIQQKIAKGTRNFAQEPAMTPDECLLAIKLGASVTQKVFQQGCNVIGFGEMGIGNTSSASALMHLFTKLPLTDCVGKGTGLDDAQKQHKLDVLQESINKYAPVTDPLTVLATFGGLEIAQMCGAMLQAAENKMILLIDGFIATATLLTAAQFYPAIVDYCLFCHQSSEKGHQAMLDYLHMQPILNLGLRLGEGTGCALAYPIIQASVHFMNDMASFETAQVSQA